MLLKDEVLRSIVEQGGNVAQFVSFAPDGSQRIAIIRGVDASYRFASIEEAVDRLYRTGTPFVNIRCFLPEKPDGNPFYLGRREGLDTPVKVAAKAREEMGRGYYIIINEEIDIFDGGFSGVLLGNVAEFATRDTPRCVEKPGCAQMSRLDMLEFARIIYEHHRINIPYARDWRVEFSVHPGPVGYGREHQIIWQVERMAHGRFVPEPTLRWPNRVSEDMGDKAYGLVMAHMKGLLVPHTRVVGRVIPPFEFGEPTGSSAPCWRRTCPKIQQPGLFTTKHGQIDPFELMQREDPDGSKIASILFQDAIDAEWSGAAITDAHGNLLIEGKVGSGDAFMVGREGPAAELPEHVRDAVANVWEKATSIFGPVRFEWCYDDKGTVWIVQLHVGQSTSVGDVIFPGEAPEFREFPVERGIEAFRQFVEEANREGFGILLCGNVGITSHFGDILRRNKIPSRLVR
jgi:hypothetical protein